MRVILRRHAQTAGNLKKQYLGSTDESLCEEGLQLLARLPANHAVQRVYVSHLVRTGQTARLLYPSATRLVVPELDEMDFGDFEGKTYQQLKDDPRYRTWLDGGQEAPCPGGEAKADFINRVCAAFGTLLTQEQAAGAEQMVVVAHGGTLMAVLSRLALPEKDYFDWHTPHGGGWLAETTASAALPLRVVEEITV